MLKGKGGLSNICRTGDDEFRIDNKNNLSNFIKILLSSARSTCSSEIGSSFDADPRLTLIKV